MEIPGWWWTVLIVRGEGESARRKDLCVSLLLGVMVPPSRGEGLRCISAWYIECVTMGLNDLGECKGDVVGRAWGPAGVNC